jgi:hypothetical protein
MAATIAAHIQAGTPIPVVAVDTTISSPETVRSWTVVRTGGGADVALYVASSSSGAYSFVDPSAPLGVPVTYTLTVTRLDYTAETVTSAAVTITGTTGCYLTNPAGDTLAVQLVSWPERQREPRQARLDVLNRADPVGILDVHSTPAGAWTFVTYSDAATDALTALLVRGAVAILRTQPASSIKSVTALVGTVTERRLSDSGTDQRRFLDVAVQEIAPLPATGLPLSATLGGLAVYDGDTLGELSQLRPTLLQLSQIVVG